MDNSITEVPPVLVSRTRTREAPWLGIGVSGEWDDYREALRAAELDFEVEQKQLYWNMDSYALGSGMGMPITISEPAPMFANVRKTDGRLLGCVTPQYHVVQNVDAFKILEPLTAAGGIITHAGMTEQGLVFMVMRMGSNLVLGDFYEFDVMCCNSFNTRFPLSLVMTPMRIICQNMYRGLTKNKDNVLRIMHGISAAERVKDAKSMMNEVNHGILAVQERIRISSMKAMGSNVELKHYLKIAFPMPEVSKEMEQVTRERIEEQRERFLDVYYNASDNVAFHGKCLGFLNAYYDFISHDVPNRKYNDWEGRRLGKIVDGSAVRFNLINALTH